jgi:hypothetical protein
MGKYFAGLILIVIGLFVLEWLGIIDIPYIELPDLTAGKQDLIQQTTTVVYKIE